MENELRSRAERALSYLQCCIGPGQDSSTLFAQRSAGILAEELQHEPVDWPRAHSRLVALLDREDFDLKSVEHRFAEWRFLRGVVETLGLGEGEECPDPRRALNRFFLMVDQCAARSAISGGESRPVSSDDLW